VVAAGRNFHDRSVVWLITSRCVGQKERSDGSSIRRRISAAQDATRIWSASKTWHHTCNDAQEKTYVDPCMYRDKTSVILCFHCLSVSNKFRDKPLMLQQRARIVIRSWSDLQLFIIFFTVALSNWTSPVSQHYRFVKLNFACKASPVNRFVKLNFVCEASLLWIALSNWTLSER
jgi:hypothetical protein